MKDIKITARRQKTEIITILVCFLIAFALNVYAIIAYNGKWSELYSTLFYLLLFTAALYVAWTVIRLVVYGIINLFKQSKK